MDTYMVIFRIIHIFAGIFWVGAALFMGLLFVPAARAQGPEGGSFMHRLFKHSRFELAMPATALLTVVSGLALYYRVSDHFNADWMESTPGLVLSVGSIAGLLSFGHGTYLGRLTAQASAALEVVYSGDGPPDPEKVAAAQALSAKTGQHANISLVLMIVAVLGMASARYM